LVLTKRLIGRPYISVLVSVLVFFHSVINVVLTYRRSCPSIQPDNVHHNPAQSLIVSSRLTGSASLPWLRRRCLRSRHGSSPRGAASRHAISAPEPRLKRPEIDRSRPEIDANRPKRRQANGCNATLTGRDRPGSARQHRRYAAKRMRNASFPLAR